MKGPALTSALRKARQALLRALGFGSPSHSPAFGAPVTPVSVAGAAPHACATVVIPALNEAKRIGEVVAYALRDAATAEVIVVDDSSTDDTVQLASAAGARVIRSSMLGKGASMRDGLEASEKDIVVYLDGDLTGLRPDIVTDLCRPILEGRADFVKAKFGRGGGRVTELTAKPMLRVFFPELAPLEQPLGGLIAARKTLLWPLEFEDGYGVDIGLVVDAHRAGARMVEVDIGSLEHDSQPLLDLTVMANEVTRVIYSRARHAGRLHVEQITAMYESQRQATASIDYILGRRRGRTHLILLDPDGVFTPGSFIEALAQSTGVHGKLRALQATAHLGSAAFGVEAAPLFRFIHRRQFEQLAHELPLRPGVIEWVNRQRRAGALVGVVSNGYFVAAEILRRRVFADFAIAHTLQFVGDVCTGECRINTAFMPPVTPDTGEAARRHVVQWFRRDHRPPGIECVWAVGHHPDSLDLLQEADEAWVMAPTSRRLARDAKAREVSSFEELSDKTLSARKAS